MHRCRSGWPSGLTVTQLWVRYVGLGGSIREQQLRAALRGGELAPQEHDVAAHALNEYFSEQGGAHPVAYTTEVNDHADGRR